MSQRLTAALIAASLLAALLVVSATVKVPFVRYEPGLTVDVLGKEGGERIIEVDGHRVHRDAGELRMTTVYVTPPEGGIDLYTALEAWFDDEQALYPYDNVYPDDVTPEDADQRSAALMVSSQDTAVAAALTEMGYDVDPVAEVLGVQPDMPSAGKLEVRDRLLRIGGTDIATVDDVFTAVEDARAGEPLEVVVQRDGRRRTVTVTPKATEDGPKVGIIPGTGFDFPFDVDVNLDPDIGGPSAGLMFSLGIYDLLTPGALTDGEVVAGTGTIDAEGKVGPIGGIQQKIVGAEDAGARLFLVPPDNCDDAVGAPVEDIRLVRAESLHTSVEAIETWTEDPDAALPQCTEEKS